MTRQICPFHSDEEVDGVKQADGSYVFRCERRGHPFGAAYEWQHFEPSPGMDPGDGVTAEFDLLAELKEALAAVSATHWVEYGMIEREYAHRRPRDFTELVKRYGHTARQWKQYTVSALLGRTLARLHDVGEVHFRWLPATGYWSYNGRIGWFALGPTPPPDEARVSCSADPDYDVREYVPGPLRDWEGQYD